MSSMDVFAVVGLHPGRAHHLHHREDREVHSQLPQGGGDQGGGASLQDHRDPDEEQGILCRGWAICLHQCPHGGLL